ncbi:ribonuclease P protein component [Sulfitobacter albidus]|uniref:ribonuclease P protein component n=1 Tax=Sulfitobacter albidus TaxID=2829501 RepID=UPI003D689BB0
MKPPQTPAPDRSESAAPAAVSACPLPTVTQRRDFQRANRAPRVSTPAFVLQMSPTAPEGPARVGFTCSKKVGNAVARNRAKRRLREIARMRLPLRALPGHDYIFIGRRDETAARPMHQMLADLDRALDTLHGRKG